MSESLLSSILSNRPSTDMIHALANPTLQLSSVHTVLEKTFSAFDNYSLARDWHSVFAGILLELYRYASYRQLVLNVVADLRLFSSDRSRSRRISKDTPAELKEQISMDERWQVALDICSVKALKSAFEACKENDEYDMSEHTRKFM
jgi:hypothetical protein